jgi:hypothetical protein
LVTGTEIGVQLRHQVVLYASNSQVPTNILSIHPIGTAEDKNIKKNSECFINIG